MFLTFWHTIFFDPVYNALVYFISVVPHGDVGVALVVLTILIKILLLPLSLKVAHTQHVMNAIQPDVDRLKEKHKNDQAKQTKEMLALYKDRGVNPFASIGIVLLQMPIIIALYLAVYRGGGVPFPDINVEYLYNILPRPETVSMMFLGAIDIASRSIPLAVLAGATQFLQTHLSMPPAKKKDPSAPQSFKDDFARGMQMQMRYVLPGIIFLFAATSAVIALYFTVSNIAGIAQEYIVRWRRGRLERVQTAL